MAYKPDNQTTDNSSNETIFDVKKHNVELRLRYYESEKAKRMGVGKWERRRRAVGCVYQYLQLQSLPKAQSII